MSWLPLGSVLPIYYHHPRESHATTATTTGSPQQDRCLRLQHSDVAPSVFERQASDKNEAFS